MATIVSMFFNLKNMPDATSSIRSPEFYKEHAQKLLSFDYPMVIFCDSDTRPILESIRISKNIVLVEKAITEYDYFKELYPSVLENRKTKPSPDPRNTGSYFLLTLFKLLALKLAKQNKYFPESTHYIWVDVGLSFAVRYRGNYIEDLPKVIENPRSKIGCCYIHYRTINELYPMSKYLSNGGKCAIASGLISVESEYVDNFYNEMFRILYEQVELGIGHAEEQILVYVYDQHPEWFSLYFGDYGSLVVNYHKPVTDIDLIKYHFIRNAQLDNRQDLVDLIFRHT
jgi:hypothetical protein